MTVTSNIRNLCRSSDWEELSPTLLQEINIGGRYKFAPVFTSDESSFSGESSFTLPAIGDTDGNRLTLDNEGNYHACKAEEFRSFGARRVENLASFSEDISNAAYTYANGAANASATSATFDGTANGELRQLAVGGASVISGEALILSVTIAVTSGTISSDAALQIGFASTSGGFSADDLADIGSDVTSGELRFSHPATSDASGDIDIIVRCDDAVTLTITKIQVENSTGRADTTTPSEYVASSVHNATASGVKLFQTLNGNSVASNVVTEAVGANISAATLLGYTAEGAATELSGLSNDFDSWTAVTSAAAVQDAVGLTGAPNEAWTITDNDAWVLESVQENTTVANDGLTHYMVTRVAYDASPSVYPFINMRLTVGTQLDQGLVLDPSDGSYVEVNTAGSTVSVVRVGDFWEVVQSLTNNTTGNTNLRMLLYPAYNTDGSVTANITAQGSTVFASCELYKTTWSYSPVLTTGGSTKTRADDVEATLASIDWSVVDAAGSISFELTPLFNDAVTGQKSILTPNSGSTNRGFALTTGVAKRIDLLDGANVAAKTSAWSTAGQTITVKARWGSSTMRMSVDGSSTASATYDGSFNASGAVTLFKALTQGAAIKNIKLYDNDRGDDWL